MLDDPEPPAPSPNWLRSAIIGSTLNARRAGTMSAASAIVAATTGASAAGSTSTLIASVKTGVAICAIGGSGPAFRNVTDIVAGRQIRLGVPFHF